MQGIYINFRRPKTKKEIKEALERDPDSVTLEATSLFGNEYDGNITRAPDGKYSFVGPDPHAKRTFYGTLTVKDGKVTVE